MEATTASAGKTGATRGSHGAATVGVRIMAAVLLVCGVGLIGWQVADEASPDGTTISALLAATVAVLALAYPRSFVSLGERISSVDAFGIKLDIKAKEEKLADVQREDDGVPVKLPEFPSSNKRAMKLVAAELRKELQRTSTRILGNMAEDPEETIVANLVAEGLLSGKEADLCLDLLGDIHKRLDDLEEDDREEFLENAWGYAARFSARTFDRQARRAFTKAGWKIADFRQEPGHRPYFIALREETRALVAARIALAKGSPIGNGKNLAKVQFPLPDLKHVIVVPDHAENLWPELATGAMKVQEGVLIMRLGRLTVDPALLDNNPADLTLATA